MSGWNTMVNSGQTIPNYRDRKQILYRDPAFQPNTVLILDSSNRSSGGISNPTFSFAAPVSGAYAVSLKSFEIPISWPNVLTAQSFTATYGSNPSSFPTSITIPVGRYNYNNEIGQLTYTTVSAAPATSYTDDLMYYILRQFAGALDSITVNASTGVWTWAWDSSLTSVTSTNVPTFFNIATQATLTWTSSGPIDLTGPKVISVCCGNLARTGYTTPIPFSPCYLVSCPIGNLNYGDLLSFVPPLEKLTFFGDAGQNISNLNLMVMDPRTGTMLPLSADWTVELKIYVDVLQ